MDEGPPSRGALRRDSLRLACRAEATLRPLRALAKAGAEEGILTPFITGSTLLSIRTLAREQYHSRNKFKQEVKRDDREGT